jgi:type I restriction enzyme S subunit
MSLVKSPAEIVAEAEESGAPGLLARHDSWERVDLRGFCTIQNGSPFSSKQFNSLGDGMPLIRIRDVGRNETDTYYSGDFDESFVVHPGDLLVGMDGDFRARRWLGPAGLLNQRVCRLVVNPEVMHQRLLELLLQGYLDAIWRETSSITVKHLSSKSIQQIPLPIPPLEEQERIVEVLEEHLSRLDAALANIQAVRTKAAQFRRSLLHTAVTGALTGESTGGPGLPKAWKLRSLGEVTSLIRNGLFVSRPAPAPPGSPILRISAVRPMHLDAGDVRYVDPEPQRAEEFQLNQGDLLFTRYSGSRDFVGACAVVPAEAEGVLHPDKLIRVVVNEAEAQPAFIAAYASSPAGRAWLESVMRTTAGQTGIAGRDLRRFPIVTPPLKTQAQIIEALESKLSRLEATLAAADRVEAQCAALRRSLLHAAFTGKLTEEWRETAGV